MIKPIMDFEQASLDTYRLNLLLPVENAVLMNVLKMSIKATKGIFKTEVKEKEVNTFEVPPEYYNTLNTYCRPLINKDVAREINPDGVFIKTHNVKKCLFEKQADESFIIRIYLEGVMIRK